MEEFKVVIDGKEHTVSVEEEGNKLKIHLEGKTYEVDAGLKKQQEPELDSTAAGSGEGTVKAALPGIIFSVDVKEGQSVKKVGRGDVLLVMG